MISLSWRHLVSQRRQLIGVALAITLSVAFLVITQMTGGTLREGLQQSVGGINVSHFIAIGHLLAAVGGNCSLHLGVGNCVEVQSCKHGLYRLCCAFTNAKHLSLLHRHDAPVDLHISLNHVPVIQFGYIKIPAPEHIVVTGNCAVSRCYEVGTGNKLQH